MIGTLVEGANGEPALEVELKFSAATCALVLRGHLCGTTLIRLEAQVDRLGCVACDEVVVDLGLLTGIDPVGANVLLGLYYYVVARGGVFRVTGACADVRTLLAQATDGIIPIDVETISALDGSF
jgi:ABC-type transporter Mla MlaB component